MPCLTPRVSSCIYAAQVAQSWFSSGVPGVPGGSVDVRPLATAGVGSPRYRTISRWQDGAVVCRCAPPTSVAVH
eukprot:110870-Lingulodinium_polyedra.AAC.1